MIPQFFWPGDEDELIGKWCCASNRFSRGAGQFTAVGSFIHFKTEYPGKKTIGGDKVDETITRRSFLYMNLKTNFPEMKWRSVFDENDSCGDQDRCKDFEEILVFFQENDAQ